LGIKVKVSESAAAVALELMQGKQVNAQAAADLPQQSRCAEKRLQQQLEQVNARVAEATRELGEGRLTHPVGTQDSCLADNAHHVHLHRFCRA